LSEQNDQIVTKDMSRRGFLKASGMAIGAAAVGIAAGCGDNTTRVIKTSDGSTSSVAWDRSTDVIVVGYGGAGAAAAWAARTAGAEVMIIERAAAGGGSTNINGGIVSLGGGTAIQQAAGVNDTPDNFYNYLALAGGPNTSAEHCRVQADNAVDLCNWLVNTCGVKFNPGITIPYPEPGCVVEADPTCTAGLTRSCDCYAWEWAHQVTPAPRGHYVFGIDPTTGAQTSTRLGSGFFQPIKKTVEALSPTIIYKNKVTQLVYDENLKRVTGVVMQAQTDDAGLEFNGQPVYVQATRAVILTAGGFAANLDMRAQYIPATIHDSLTGTVGDDGTGIRIGMDVGADVRNMGYADGNLALMEGALIFAANTGGPMTSSIFVDKRGNRFISEDHYRAYTPVTMRTPSYAQDYEDGTSNVMGVNGYTCYVICDATTWNNCSSDVINNPYTGINVLSPPTIKNTITELAQSLGLPNGSLESTIALYNQNASANSTNLDPVFHKRDQFVRPIVAPPFYGFPLVSTVGTFTTGGLKINTEAQVIEAVSQQPISGLYAAGRNASDVIGQFYQGSGTGVASAFIFGRIAGANAAAEKPWTASTTGTTAA
jgi:3-oxo-5alpha-steroid 4-dehydrogenase